MSHVLCMGHKTGNRTSMQAGWPSNIICSINLKVHFLFWYVHKPKASKITNKYHRYIFQIYLPNVEAKGTPTSVQSYNVCNMDGKKLNNPARLPL